MHVMFLLVISEKAKRPITEDFLQYRPQEGENMSKKLSLESILLFSLIFISIAGCAGQVSQMSLEEAKQVTVSTSSASGFVPPPRRIDDITAILNQPGKFDARLAEKLKAQANATPPANADSSFYLERGWAARNIGRDQQALADLREALRLAEKSGTISERIYNRLSPMEKRFGNFARAVQIGEEGSRIAKGPSAYARLVDVCCEIGDLERAQKAASEAKLLCSNKASVWCDIEKPCMEAVLLGAQAKYAEAEKYIRQLQRQLPKLKEFNAGRNIESRLWLARNLMRQGRFIEAEIEAREALKESLGLGGEDSVLTTSSVYGLANILRAQGRLPEAEKLALLDVHALESSGMANDSQCMIDARSLLGSILAAQGNYSSAMEQFSLALKGMQKDQYLYKSKVFGNPDIALSLLITGRHDEAAKMVADTYNMALQRFGDTDYLAAESLALRGMLNFRTKNLGAAVKDFSAATDKLLTFQMDKADYSRTQRLRVILEDYLRLLDEIHGKPMEKGLGIDAVATAFMVADGARGHSVQGALAASSARTAELNPELSDLIRREQDARKQVEVLESTVINLLAAPSQEQKPEMVKELQGKIQSLTKAAAVLQDEIRRRFPKYAGFVNPQAATWSLARQNLRPGEVLISIYSSDDKTYVWAVPYQGEVRYVSSPLRRKELNQIVANLRRSLDPDPKSLGDIPEFNVAQAYEIYDKLLKPVEASWKDASHLLIIANNPLGQLPFSVLPTSPVRPEADKEMLFAGYRKVPWLIRKASVTMLPSVNSLVTLRSLPGGDAGRKAFAGFGDPIFSPRQAAQGTEIIGRSARLHVRGIRVSEKGSLDSKQLDSSQLAQLIRLPDTADEIKDIALALGADLKQDVFLGKDASKQKIRTMNLADRRVIAFATHALLPGDLDGLDQPALAFSSPAVTGVNDDGLLTLSDILRLKLNADWVVLSACNTGAGDGQGAEAVSGLGRAFFYAGTRSLLVSMWPVETTSARKLVTETFRFQKEEKTLTRDAALRKSMLALMDEPSLKDDASGKVVASYAHPFFWAPFVMVGDPGMVAGSP
jgi:CHAT domain-containing protein